MRFYTKKKQYLFKINFINALNHIINPTNRTEASKPSTSHFYRLHHPHQIPQYFLLLHLLIPRQSKYHNPPHYNHCNYLPLLRSHHHHRHMQFDLVYQIYDYELLKEEIKEVQIGLKVRLW